MTTLLQSVNTDQLCLISVYVNPSVKKKVLKRKAQGGYLSESEYVRSLILEDVKRK
jgi:hypothetical protein